MIELVSASRCISCNICVKVCPTNVFDARDDAAPVIARQNDCQTCFLCEAYCPVDALFVSPDAHRHVEVSEAQLSERGDLGSYRRALGWSAGGDPAALHEKTQVLRTMAGTAAIG
jgi:NAD-dependent dihydropyrimidine dehydrogenase PreA subunit